jgi:pyrophosphatase PpaX
MAGYHTILFDFDGTLISSLACWLRAFQQALAALDHYPAEEEIIQRCFSRSYPEMAEHFRLESAEELGRLVEAQLIEEFRSVLLFPGVQEVLAWCEQQHLHMGLVTSGAGVVVHSALTQLGITHYFGAVITRETTALLKPYAQPVHAALEQLHGDAATTLFVGDNDVDILAGRAAGTRTALFLPELHTRFYDFARLRATQPDFIFHDPRQLLGYLQERT